MTAVAERPALNPAEKPYRPVGALLELFRSREREVVVEGPADTGKSRGCLEKVHACCEKYPGARWAFVRKTRASLHTTAQVTYERWVLPLGAAHLVGQEYRYPNGSRIYLLGMDDPERIQSMELDGAYVQQAEELNVEDWEILSKCITGRGATMPYVQLLADMNPVDPGFHLYAREAAGAVRFITARHEDNPSITPERIAALDALTGYRYKRLRLGLRVAAEGMYFEDWDPDRHVVDAFDPPAHWTRWTATDYGFAAPFVTLFLARDPNPPRPIYVYGELYARGLRDEQQARLIKQRIDRERLELELPATRRLFATHAGDPSMFNARGEQNRPSIASVYRQHGIDLKPATNNRRAGWQAVLRALAWRDVGVDGEVREYPPRLRVMRGRAPNLIRTLPTMVRDALDPEDVADVANGQKTEDDPVDALRYALMVEAAPSRPHGSRPVKVGAG